MADPWARDSSSLWATATEVLLLATTAGAATQGLPWYALLALPVFFSGGMLFLDTCDGLFMNFAYGWAFARPVRKVYYNLVITGLSVAVWALAIGYWKLARVETRWETKVSPAPASHDGTPLVVTDPVRGSGRP